MALASNRHHGHRQEERQNQQPQQQKEQCKAILVVDDEYDIVRVIEKSSQIIGFDTAGFTDPLLALEHFKANYNEYFLVISDLAMPSSSMNGFEFTKKIRSILPGIKVFLMTASNITDSALFSDFISSLKIDCIIQKPISLQALKDIIEKQSLLHASSNVSNNTI